MDTFSESDSSHDENLLKLANDVEMDSNYELKGIFYEWLKNESERLHSKLPNDLKNLLEEINQNYELKHKPFEEEIIEWLNTLDNCSYFDYLRGKYNEIELMNQMKLKSNNWKTITKLTKDFKSDIEDKILQCFTQLSIKVNDINLKKYSFVLSKWINKRSDNLLTLLQSRIFKKSYSIINKQEELVFKKAWVNGQKNWSEIYKKHLRDYKLWGICFKIIFNSPIYLILNKDELNLLERLQIHHRKYIKEGLSGNWVNELKNNKRLEQENIIELANNEISKKKKIGFSVWNYWNTSFKHEERYLKIKDDSIKWRYKRKEIENYEYDFRVIPKEIETVPKVYLDYIQMGIVYQKPTFNNSLKMMMITGDTSFRLSNGSIGSMKKLGLKKLKKNSDSEAKILRVINWLKENNHLSRSYITNFESNALLDKIEESNKNNIESITDDYFIVDEIDVDRKIHNYQIIENIGRRYAISKDIFEKLKENKELKIEINKSVSKLVFYDDPYLEEKLFVHLFPFGTGGYNSTFSKIMDFSNYVRMRLMSGYTNRFRKDKEYIFFLFDWAKKRQIYSNNFIYQRVWLSNNFDKNFKKISFTKINSRKDYYKKLGSKVPQTMRYSYNYKRNRFYEVQTLLYNYGIPNLFVTISMDHKDKECEEFVKNTFCINNEVSWVKDVVEYSIFFKKKIDFIRAHFKNKNKHNIFGKIIAYCDTIEYTSSGIPHLHALLWLSNEFRQSASIEHNNFVFARISNPRVEEDKELNLLIKKYQMHTWLREKCNIKKNGQIVNYWLNGFPFKEIQNDWVDQNSNRILYKRIKGDENVVPYNPELLKLMRWHTNVQIVSSDTVAVYLSKYITKINRFYFKDSDRWKIIEKNKDVDLTEVEQYFKERKVGAIEAWNDLICVKHYSNYPAIVDLHLTLPSERVWKLIQFKDLKKILDKMDDNEQDEEEEINEGYLQPNVWENYLCRNNQLENLTFPEMLTKYKWTSRFDLIPKSATKVQENGEVRYWLQLPLKFIYNKLIDRYNWKSESSTINKITKEHLKVNMNQKFQNAKYWFKRNSNILFNWKYKIKKEKDELYWFIVLLDREHFRSFDELLTHNGSVYESFFTACKAKGYIEESEEKDLIFTNRFNIGGLENAIHGFANGKICYDFDEMKLIVLRMIQVIQLKNDNEYLKKLKELSIQYYCKFPLLFDEIQKASLLTLKDDPFSVFKKEISSDKWWKAKWILKWGWMKYNDEVTNEEDEEELVWKHFHRYEPVIVEGLNKEKEIFLNKYLNFTYFSRSQKKIIDFLVKNLFHPKINCFFITGYAGWGKSFLLKELVLLLRNVLNLNVMVCATTGTAAKNIDGVTVHQGFKYNSKNVWSLPQPGSFQFENLKKQDVIIIDEISMMTGELLDFIDACLRNTSLYSNNDSYSFYSPFGGKMIVLFGDLLQIPWVQEEIVGTKIRKFRKITDTYIFQHFVWLFLKEQKRQAKDSIYYRYWKSIALGDINKGVINWLRSKVWCTDHISKKNKELLQSLRHKENVDDIDEWDIDNTKTDITWVASTNSIRNLINEKRINSEIQTNIKRREYKALYYSKAHEITDENTLNYLRSQFSDDHIHEEWITLMKGAKVILNVNIDVKVGLTNGTFGRVKDLEEHIIHFEYEFKGEKLVAFITRTEKEETVPYMDITRCQFPISLAYCLTMHKCQGQTLEGVVIEWDEMQTEGLFYSILARCKNSNRIHIKNLNVDKHIRTDIDVVNLVKKKEAEFDNNFEDIEWEYGIINKMERLITIVRETKISYAYLHLFVHNVINENKGEWKDSLYLAKQISYEFFKLIEDQVIKRENYMMEKYAQSLEEHPIDEQDVIDWRTGLWYNSEVLMKRLIEKWSKPELPDESQLDIGDDMNDLSYQNQTEVQVDDYKDTLVDMDVDAKFIKDTDDEYIPWWFWNKDYNGFDWLLLLFYFSIYLEINEESQKYLKTFKPNTLNNKNKYQEILNAIRRIERIDIMMEFESEEKWERVNNVVIPWLSSLKANETIENQLKCFENQHLLFNIRFQEIITCYGKWKQNNNKIINKNDKNSLNCIVIKNPKNKSSKITNIDNNILQNVLMRDLFEKWPVCKSKMAKIEFEQTVFPEYIWIINDQESYQLNRSEFSTKIRINSIIELGTKLKHCYKLNAIIFNSEYNYSCWVNIKVQGQKDEEWFEYDGEKNINKILRLNENIGRVLIFNKNLKDINSRKWPRIILFKKMHQKL